MAKIHCPQCAYDLTGLPENRCPECGLHFDPEQLAAGGQRYVNVKPIGALESILRLAWPPAMFPLAIMIAMQVPEEIGTPLTMLSGLVPLVYGAFNSRQIAQRIAAGQWARSGFTTPMRILRSGETWTALGLYCCQGFLAFGGCCAVVLQA